MVLYCTHRGWDCVLRKFGTYARRSGDLPMEGGVCGEFTHWFVRSVFTMKVENTYRVLRTVPTVAVEIIPNVL